MRQDNTKQQLPVVGETFCCMRGFFFFFALLPHTTSINMNNMLIHVLHVLTCITRINM